MLRIIKRQKIYLTIIFLVAVVLRLGYVLTLEPDKLYYADEHMWDATAMNIASGKGHFAWQEDLSSYVFRVPLQSIFLAVIFKIKHSYMLVRIIQAVIGAVIPVLIFLLADLVYDKKAIAYIASLIGTVYPFLIYYTGYLLAESNFTFLFLVAMYFICRMIDKQYLKQTILSGIFLGLATLTRPVVFYFPIMVFIWLFVSYPRRYIQSILAVVLLSIAMLLVMSPWIIRNYLLLGKFIPTATEGGYVFYVSNNPWAAGTDFVPRDDPIYQEMLSTYRQDPVKGSRIGYSAGKRYILHNLKDFLKLIPKKLYHFWKFYPQTGYTDLVNRRTQLISIFSYGLLFPFSLLGMVVSFKIWRRTLIFYLLIFYFILVAMAYYGSTRLRFPICPYLIIFGASGLVSTYFWLRRRKVFFLLKKV